ncbi:threonine synthase-like 2 [Glandiceps talaboti]
MKYCSTRGGVAGWSFEQALFSPGFMKDGGLLMPETIPRVSHDTLQQWKSLSYPELCKEIIPLFISEEEIPRQDMNELLDKAFSKFEFKDIVKVAKLKDGLNVAELWHGKTLAFKDLSTSCLGQFFEYFLKKSRKHITVIVATSGDTGSSAIQGLCGLEWVDIIVLLPKGRITKIQELMMTTVIDDKVHVMAGENTTTDCLDLVVNDIYMDQDFKDKHNLCSLNSINWARVMIQIVHHFYSYFQVCESCDQTVEVIVPTGGAGNVAAGCIAKFMGLPIKIVTAVNANDILFRTLQSGDHSLAKDVVPTHAPAMDVQFPFNFERLLWLFSNQDAVLVDKFMKAFNESGRVKLSEEIRMKMNTVVSSYRLDDEGILQTMKKCWHDNQYLLCPHTAIAVSYYYEKGTKSDEKPQVSVCIATASPVKFPEAVLEAGLTPQTTPEVEALESMPTRYTLLKEGEDWNQILRKKIEKVTSKANTV